MGGSRHGDRFGRDVSRRQRGVALLIVLWVVALLGVITGSYAISVRTETTIVDNLVASAQARAAARAGVHIAVAQLLDGNATERWRTDGTEYDTEFLDARLRIAVTDESGKINLNRAQGELIGNLLRAAGVAEDRVETLVDAVLDWRDEDDLRRLNGAEHADYRAAGRNYAPRNAPFQSIDELALVLGLEPSIFDVIRSALTVYSGTPGLDTTVAGPLARLALSGGSPVEINETGTAPTQIQDDDPAASTPDAAYPHRSLARRTFSIYVEARMPGGTKQGVTAVVNLQSTRPDVPFSVLAWRETAEPMFR